MTKHTVPCAILGSGNIGTDLLFKLRRSEVLEPTALVGIDPESDGLRRARELGLDASAEGVDWIVEHPEQCEIVFEATSAGAHVANAPRLAEAGLQSIDLTPAKLGPGVVPVVNLEEHAGAPDVNLITCGGQATIPMVAAVSRATDVPYAETVSTVASLSAGPGTRQSIDAFTRTTAPIALLFWPFPTGFTQSQWPTGSSTLCSSCGAPSRSFSTRSTRPSSSRSVIASPRDTRGCISTSP